MNWRIHYEGVAVAICNKLCGFSMAALAATSLFAARPAAAGVIEINNFPAGNGSATFNFAGMDWRNGSTVKSGETAGADNFHSFGFAVDSNGTEQPAEVISSTAAVDLGRLYTNHPANLDSTYSSALVRMRQKELGIPAAGNYAANIRMEQSAIMRGQAQGAAVFAPVPEPQTYAMMLVGLGLLGVSVRRKN
jgi:hypothetical protein